LINPGEAKLLNPIYLEAGEDNVLIFRVTRGGPQGNDYMYMHSLELEYISDAPTIESVVVEAEKTTLALGETSRIDTIATLSTGAEYEFGFMHGYTNNAEYPDNKRNENAYVEYVSSDENVAKVVDGKIAEITYQYDFAATLSLKILVGNVNGSGSAKTTGKFTNIAY
jgi:hypothetical protein